MAIQLVVDTNVLVHAKNENYHSQEYCIDIINLIINRQDIFICLDESYDGHIYFEYKKHLKLGDLGFTMLLTAVNRILFISREIPAPINNKINRTGIKTADRIFVRIAYKTNHKILISEEHEDFTNINRKRFKKEIGVQIIMAEECISKLKA